MQNESSEKIYINSGNEEVFILVTIAESRILDVGCGSGAFAKNLSAAGHTVDSITFSAKEYEAAGKFLHKVYVHNLETGLPDNILPSQYDYVICSHVLEHIVYPEKL